MTKMTNLKDAPVNANIGEQHCQFLNDIIAPSIFKKLETPSVWNEIFPAPCYNSNFSWATDCIRVLGQENLGTFVDLGAKEAKDITSIEFSDSVDRIDLYDKGAELVASATEIEKYQMWTTNAGLSSTSYIDQLVSAAVSRYNRVHNQFFFFGDGRRTKGLFGNPALVDIPKEKLMASPLRLDRGGTGWKHNDFQRRYIRIEFRDVDGRTER
jgi:hypothetical protein